LSIQYLVMLIRVCYITFVTRDSISVKNYQDYLEAWEKIKARAPFNIVLNEIRCVHCHSKEISKYGSHKNIQRWWCKECKRKFADNKAYPGTKITTAAVSSALAMFYKGVPLNLIRQQLEEEYNCYPSASTISRWVKRISLQGQQSIKNHQPEVGNTWLVYESTIKVGTKPFWMFDIVDTLTHYLLASTLSHDRNLEDIKILIESARDRARKIPEVLITRSTTKYSKVAELALGSDAYKIRIEPFAQKEKMKFSKYWLGMLKKRRILLVGFKQNDMIQVVLKGWMLYYNYYLTQESLNGNTPSQAARIEYQYQANRWTGERQAD
jgi:putative transposase